MPSDVFGVFDIVGALSMNPPNDLRVVEVRNEWTKDKTTGIAIARQRCDCQILASNTRGAVLPANQALINIDNLITMYDDELVLITRAAQALP